jgi:dolichol-phosphate mannosyltransferase
MIREPAASAARRRVHVVLPAYDEAPRLPPLLASIHDALTESGLPWDVVLVDDGSTDGTGDIAQAWARDHPLRYIRHERNQGLGATIRDGLLEAAGAADPEDVVVTMDADDTHSPGLIARMERMIAEGYDVVVASRYQPGSRTIGVPFSRRVMSRVGSLLFRVVLPIPGVRDYTCGFRAFRASVLQGAIAEYGRGFVDQEGFQSMVDILLKLRGRGLVFGEVPMVLRYDRKEGASKMDVRRTTTATLRLMLRRRLGR